MPAHALDGKTSAPGSKCSCGVLLLVGANRVGRGAVQYSVYLFQVYCDRTVPVQWRCWHTRTWHSVCSIIGLHLLPWPAPCTPPFPSQYLRVSCSPSSADPIPIPIPSPISHPRPPSVSACPQVFSTNLTREYVLAHEKFGLSCEELRDVAFRSIGQVSLPIHAKFDGLRGRGGGPRGDGASLSRTSPLPYTHYQPPTPAVL